MYHPLRTPHLLISLSLLFSFITLTTSKQCNPYDENVLLEMKKQFGNPSSMSLWNPLKDCCNGWGSGILCNDEGHIVYLRLDGVSGDFPPAIVDLTSLQTLQLVNYNLSVPFPKDICKMTYLIELSIQSTTFFGPIPNCLGRLKNLTSLEISQNDRITGPIPKALAQLASLNFLMLPFNNLSGPIPIFLGRMRSLESIDLDSNSLSGSIPTSLGHLPGLHFLDLSGNRLTGSIPKSFGSFRKPMFIRLSGNQLSGPIPRAMGRVNASIIDFSDNNLTGDASFLFGRRKTFADIINLSNNKLKFNFSKVDLPLGITVLNISHNKIYGSLPKKLAQLELEIIDVSYNQLCGPIPISQKFSPIYFAHNKCLCGPPLPACK